MLPSNPWLTNVEALFNTLHSDTWKIELFDPLCKINMDSGAKQRPQPGSHLIHSPEMPKLVQLQAWRRWLDWFDLFPVLADTLPLSPDSGWD
jgi:hypothetical protein